jgi:hypothetical protein
MCGDNGCALSDAERGDNTECVIYTQIKNRTIARVYRSTTTGNYEHCWDALGNAIEQCFRDISESYTGAEGITQGTWSLDGEYYWVQIWTSDEFAIYEPEGQGVIGIDLDEVDNDPDTPGRELVYLINNCSIDANVARSYVWGPQFYCMTPSTGGVTCFPIEKGCFILSPVDDTIPDIICG